MRPALLRLLGGLRLEYAATVVVLCLMSAAEGVAHPLLIKGIFDEGVMRSDFGRFLSYAVAYLVFGLIVNVAGAATAMWAKSLENRIVATTSREMLRAYYANEYESVLSNGHGYFINRIYGDVQDGLVPLLRLIQSAAGQLVLVIASSAVLIYLSWRAFLVLGLLVPVSMVFAGLLGKRIKALTAQEREQQGAVMSVLTDALGAFRIVRGFGLVTTTVDAFDRRLGAYLSTGYRRYTIARTFQALNDSMMVISDFLSVFVGALFVLRGALTFGGYLAFVNTFWRAVTTTMQLIGQVPEFQRLGVITDRVAAFLAVSARAEHPRGASASLDRVAFSYGDAPVLDELSLAVGARERIVVVGANGSGKTTLANVLSGFLAPSRGELVVPERISAITLPIAFPPVAVRELVADGELLAEFGLAGEAVLSAHGDELSSGQQQKLALALALSREADLYVLDEPLANLDRETRERAMRLLFERTNGRALVAIMHGCEEYHHLFDRVVRIDDLRAPARVPVAASA